MTTKKGTKYSKRGRSPPGHPVTCNPPRFSSVQESSSYHAKVPKEQDWLNAKPGLDCSSNKWVNPSSHQCDFYILNLLCWSSVVLCRWRGSCPDLSSKQKHGLSVSFLTQGLKHSNHNRSFSRGMGTSVVSNALNMRVCASKVILTISHTKEFWW